MEYDYILSCHDKKEVKKGHTIEPMFKVVCKSYEDALKVACVLTSWCCVLEIEERK